MPRKKEIETERTKRRLLDEATRKIMAETQSFDALTIKRICEAAGVSSGVFYYYYKSKDDAVINQLHYMSELYEGFMEDNAALNAAELLHRYYKIYCSEMRRNGKSVTKGFMQALYNDGNYLIDMTSIHHVGLLEEIFERGFSSGMFYGSKTPFELAQHYVISMRGMVFHWSCCTEDFDLEDAMETMVSALVSKLVSQNI